MLVDVLLRAAMSPAALQDVPVSSLLGLPDVDLGLVVPDRRLAWIAGAVEDGLLADVATPVDRDQVLRRLGAAGVATMTREQHRAWATELVAELNRTGPGRYAMSTSGDPHDGAMDDYQRERVRLAPEPLPLVPVSPADEGWSVGWLARADDAIGAHAWLVWMLPAMLGRQFIVDPELLERDAPLLGFLGIDRLNGPPMARFWPFPSLSPSVVAAGLGEAGQLRVIFFSTQATLAASETEALEGICPAFVLVDGPLERLVADARADGATLGWRGARLSGSRDLGVLVLERDDRPGLYYLVVTSLSGHEAFVRWLGLRASDTAQQTAKVAAEHAGHLKALLDHLVGSFWELDLLATTERSSP